MKTDIENLSNLERKLNIQISVEQVNSEFTNAFKHLQKSVEVKGFRKGKTPLETIRSLYGDKIKGDVAQNLVQTFYFKALKESWKIVFCLKAVRLLFQFTMKKK